MADRRTGERSVAPDRNGGKTTSGPATPAGGTKPTTGSAATGTGKTGRPSEAGPGTEGAPGTTEGTQSSLSRGQERFAAAVAKAREGGKSARSSSGPSRKTASGSRPAPRRVRRARLRLTHIDPWSVMKTAFLLSIAIGIVTVVAVGIVWSVLGAAGVWDSIDSAVADVVGDTGGDFEIQDYLGTSRIMGITMLLAVVDVFLITVVATLGAFLYNLAAALLGGLEVVFAEEDR